MGSNLVLLLVTGTAVAAFVLGYRHRRNRARAYYQRCLEAALADGVLTADEIAELDRLRTEKDLTPAEVRMVARATYRTILREAMKEERLSEAEDRSLSELQVQLGLTDRDLEGEDRVQLSRLRTLARLERGQLPVIESPINLVPHERAHWVVQAAFAERLDLPSPGRKPLRGVKLEVVSDEPFHADGPRDALRPAEDILPNDLGIFVITSRRCVFQGVKGNLSIPHARLDSLTIFADALRLDELGGEARGYFLADDAELTAAVLLHAARKRRQEIRPIGLARGKPA
jgi:hypothetical protein